MEKSLQPEDQIMMLFRRMTALPVMSPPKESPLSMPQIAMLNWVAHNPGCGVLDIAKGLNVTAPTVSVGIRRMVKSGWLEQRQDPNDRRARPIYLTEKGNALDKEMKANRAQMLKLFLSGLTQQEQEQLIYLLDRAISALETAQVDEIV